MYLFDGRVRYSECDETGRLSLVSMMNYLQDCSTFQSEEVAGGIGGLAGRGLAWVLATWSIEVDRLPRFGERIVSSTWCYEMTRAHALRCFRLADAEGHDLVRADSQWFVYDFGKGHAALVPADQRVYLSEEPRLAMGALPRRIRAAGEGAKAPAIVVERSDLDTNQHVNNANYVRFATNALAALGLAAPVAKLQVQYRSMAFLGDAVVPTVYECEGGHDVELASEQGDVLAMVRIQEREGAVER